jgi:hypothetical protein
MTPAQRMAVHLHAQTRVRIAFEALAQAADEGDSSLPTSPLRRRILADAVQELHDNGTLRLPIGDHGWDHSALPPLPRWVDRLAPRRTPAARPAPRAWTKALTFASRLTLSQADQDLLAPINVLQRDRPDAEPVPVAERSYELYGDEKHLARIGAHHLVTAGLLSVAEHLRAFPAPAPLAMFELGPAPWMLIVENSAAFTSLRRIFTTWPSRTEVGWLAYGKGDQLIASLPTCLDTFAERAHPVTDLLLYTDLDTDGLECAQLAAERAHAVGLPPLRPAAGLYRALLGQKPRAVPPGDAGRIRAAADWLPPPYADQAVQLLLSGRVLRQEALPLPEVRSVLNPGRGLLPQLLGHPGGGGPA